MVKFLFCMAMVIDIDQGVWNMF